MSTNRKRLYVDHSLSAEVLREGRMQLGLTQRELADQLDMEPGTYSACENGKRRYPLKRLTLLPRDLALRVRDALVEEFATDLDKRLDGGDKALAKRRRPPKALVATQAAAVD